MAEQQSQKTHVFRDPIQRPKIKLAELSGEKVTGKTPGKPKSKNVLPKSLRYDLENALVGLCDVWFEDIKPYLERNNIKVHVQDVAVDKGDGDGERCAEVTPDCEHLHPASTAPRCELCRLLFNAANSIDSAVSQAASVSAVSLKETLNTEVNLGSEIRRKFKKKALLETFASRHRHIMEPTKLVSPIYNDTKIDLSNSKAQLKDASTQTEVLKGSLRPTRRRSIRSGHQLNRHSAPATFLPPIKKNIVDSNNFRDIEVPPLFKNDLIDIIREKHEERLRVLHKSPQNNNLSLYLFSPHKSGKKIAESKKERPWK